MKITNITTETFRWPRKVVISNGLLLELHRDSTNPLWQKAYKSPLSLNDDGTVSPPEVPGAGIDPNYEVLNQYRVA